MSSESQPILMTESPLNPKRNREITTQIMFETFNVPALYVASTSVLALRCAGFTDGVVIDSGYDVTFSVPVRDGSSLPHAIVQSDFGGRPVAISA